MKVGIRARHARVFVFGMSACTYTWVYMTLHWVVCMGSRIVTYSRALYRSSHTHMCVQPWVQLHRLGGSSAHCCSTCLQLHTPNTQVSTVHSLLTRVRSSGTCLCKVCTIALCIEMKVGIRARHARVFVFGMSVCTYAWMYMTSHLVICMGSRIVSYEHALYRSSLTHMCVQP
jgi:hypothetical protein